MSTLSTEPTTDDSSKQLKVSDNEDSSNNMPVGVPPLLNHSSTASSYDNVNVKVFMEKIMTSYPDLEDLALRSARRVCFYKKNIQKNIKINLHPG